MLEKNLETLQNSIEALDRRDWEAWLKLNDPDAEFRADPEWPEAKVVHGREAVWDEVVSIVGAWEQTPSNVVEVIEAGHDRLMVRFRQPVRGKVSGVETEFDYSLVATFRRGSSSAAGGFRTARRPFRPLGCRRISTPTRGCRKQGLAALLQLDRLDRRWTCDAANLWVSPDAMPASKALSKYG